MRKAFTAKLRASGDSLLITLPKPLVEQLSLKVGDIREFCILIEDWSLENE